MKILPFAVSIAICLLNSGCLSKPALVKETFALSGPGKLAAAAAASSLPPLGIKTFNVVPAYESRLFLYRVSDESFEMDPYAELLVPPSRLMPTVLRAHLRASGVFKSITEPGSSLAPALNAEVTVTEFYGDMRESHQPAAVLAMRIVVLEAAATVSAEPFFQGELSRRIPIRTRTAAAVAAGWTQALAEIADDFVSRMKSRP